MNKTPLWQKFVAQKGRLLLPNALVGDKIIEALPSSTGKAFFTKLIKKVQWMFIAKYP